VYQLTRLAEVEGFCEAAAVTPDGTMVVGNTWPDLIQPWHTSIAAAWRWNSSTSMWNQEILGSLPGTTAPFGLAIAADLTADGTMVVGYNRFSGPTSSTGFVWTEVTGIIDVEEFLTVRGIALDSKFDIRSLDGVSDDGSVLVGTGQQTVEPYYQMSFLIRLCNGSALAGDGNEDGVIDLPDIAQLQQGFTGPDAGLIPVGYAAFDADCDVDVDIEDVDGIALNYGGPQ
jgi:hypothetical protein